MRHARRRNRGLVIASALVFVQTLFAAGQEPPLTLEAARQAARRTHPLLAGTRAAVEAAAGLERQAGALPNPMIVYAREETSGTNARNTQDIAAVDQRLDLWSRSPRIEVTRLRRAAAEARLADAVAEIELEAARAWAEAIAADRRAALADTAMRQFQEAVRVVGERFEAGDASGYEARRLELEAARYATLAAEAQRDRSSARLRLAALTGAPTEIALPTLGEVARTDRSATPSADSAAGIALANSPALRTLMLEGRAVQADARHTRSLRLPQPVLTVGYKNERAPGTTGSLSGFVAGVSLSVPAWTRNEGAVAAADAESVRSAARVDALRLEITRDVRAAHDAVTRTDAQVATLAPQLGARSDAALLAARTAYGEGEISLLEFLDTVRAYREAEVVFAVVVAESIIQRAELERLLGVSLLR